MVNLFISGTDTGVGKTLIASGLVRLARRRGINCVGIKPVETGCPIRNGMLEPLDGMILWEAGDRVLSLDECAPFRFALPAAPFRAAAMEDSNLSVADIVEHVMAVSEDVDMSVVEGAGGLMAPVEDRKMMIDVMKDLQLPTLLVARMALGTINHTLLSLEALQKRDIAVKGIILSASKTETGPEEEYTPGDLARLVGQIPIVKFPYMGHEAVSPDDVAVTMTANWPETFIREIIGFRDV